jgi:diacylglycerol kinase family enzyme
MRALFVVNPNATTTGSADPGTLAATLGKDIELTVRATLQRGHATEIAEHAADEGVGLVIAYGGDGTVNEIVNGLMRTPQGERPMVAVVPGGHGNVFSRALGQSTDPTEVATGIAAALRTGVTRTVSLGDAGGRFFTFAAGFGFDARVVRQVDLGRSAGRSATTPQYVSATLREYLRSTPWRRAPLTLITPSGMMTPGLHLLIVANTTPWTYLGDQPLHACPDASFEAGLDILGLRRFGPATLAQTFAQVLTAATPAHRHIVRLHDLDGVSIHSHLPISVQLDGEYAGEASTMTLRAHRAALRVVVGAS